MKRNCLIFFLLMASFSANATIRYVSMLGNDNNNGLAWWEAKRSIGAAVNEAVQEDTIFVAIGTYPKFSAKNGIHIFGGFLGIEQSLAERQPMHHGYLQDSSCSRIFTASHSEQFLTSYYSCIDYKEAATVPTVIDGFVVKVDGGYDYSDILILALLDGSYHLTNSTLDGRYTITGWSGVQRAGYGYCTTSSGSGFHVSDCTIKNCAKGCLLSRGSRTSNCLFEYNGVPIETRQMNNDEYGLICIEDCVIENNRCNISNIMVTNDRALLNLYCGVDLRRCVIRNNSLVVTSENLNSAEIITAYKKCRITDCLFANNEVCGRRTRSNLVYMRSGANILQNNTIVSNRVNDSLPNEPSRLLRADGSISLYNNLFWGNTGHSQFFYGFNSTVDNVMFNGMQDTLLGQTSNFRLDQDSIGPLFVSPTTFAGARLDADSIQQVLTADWHLTSGSSCVNAGHPYYVSLPCQPSTDLDGLNRVSGGHIDIGCYEFPEADAEQHIVWEQTLEEYRSAGQLALTATATSELPVSYTSSNSNVATVSGDTLLLIASGRCTITATQYGDSIWLPAPSISRIMTVYGDTVTLHDTVWANDTLIVYDTVTGEIFDTIPIYDTVTVFDTVAIYDTVHVPVEYVDTLSVVDTSLIYDTLIVYDTVDVQIFDTIPIYDTVTVFDTVTIYDTVQVSIEDIDITSLSWTITVEDEYVSVCGAEGETIRVFDALGRQLHMQPAISAVVRFRMPSSGMYLIKVGSSPAQKVTIIR